MRHVLALVLTTSTAAAGPHEVSIGSSSRKLRTESANALTADSLSGGELGYAHALGRELLLPGLALWGSAGFTWGSADGVMFRTLTTQLETMSFTVGARARYSVHPRVNASGRLDLGAARAALTLSDSNDHSARDSGWGATAMAALGVDLLAIRKERFALGLRLELGIVGASPIGLTPQQSETDDTIHLDMTAASFGSVNLSGGVFTGSVVSEF